MFNHNHKPKNHTVMKAQKITQVVKTKSSGQLSCSQGIIGTGHIDLNDGTWIKTAENKWFEYYHKNT
jgi:hypothetical protein